MIYLSGCIWPVRDMNPHRPDLGIMLSYPHKQEWDKLLGGLRAVPWAADNGCFSSKGNFDVGKYLCWLSDLQEARSTCLFATAPDVIGDAQATYKRAVPVLPLLRQLGYQAAYVAQDGLTTAELDWDAFDCLFIGGSTEYKLSAEALAMAREARARSKWVHMGRVNSLKRLRIASANGCNSADGTIIRFGPDKHFPAVIRWVEEVNGVHS